MANKISQKLKNKILAMPEYRQGVNKVKVRLNNGTVYEDVFIAWGNEIVKVGESLQTPFDVSDIVDIENDL